MEKWFAYYYVARRKSKPTSWKWSKLECESFLEHERYDGGSQGEAVNAILTDPGDKYHMHLTLQRLLRVKLPYSQNKMSLSYTPRGIWEHSLQNIFSY